MISDKLEETKGEWRAFTDTGASRARTGSGTSITMHDMGLTTIIGTADKDSSGKPLPHDTRSTMNRLRTWDSRSQVSTSADRNLRQALTEMNKIKDKLALSDATIEKAAHIYRKSMSKKLIRGRSIQGLVAACLYAACRNTETPRTLNDIADGINIRKKDLARCYRLICRELDLKMPVADPVKGLSRIASLAKLSEKTKRNAIHILNQAKHLGMAAGKDPMGMAAAALYLACINNGEPKSQRDISRASGVTEVTIRNRCANLKEIAQL